ncbi:MAG: tRNA uridine-5-carboxymethylaminomethyl(34) synthesis GTPase MnmE [Eubacteriales bacterium]
MNDTIAAISTPYGRGGVALIRISGENAIAVADRVFRAKSGKSLADIPSGRATYGTILSEGQPIDDGLITCFRAPASYTGEDVAEISCHGGILLTEKVLTAVLTAGARMAEAGEFTRRAFLSGKLSLTRAEAVIDLIDAESEEQLRMAKSQLGGSLSRELDDLYEKLRTLVSAAYVYADYPDEDLSDVTPAEMTERLTEILDRLTALHGSYRRGRAVREGIATVLVGRPNTGKSSLLNRLLGRDRAIVTDYAGTTRDTLEESVMLDKIVLRLTDTAGIRPTDDPVEKIGVERSVAALETAELVLAVFDGSAPAAPEDLELIGRLKDSDKVVLAILNKSDLPRRFDADLTDFDGIFPLSAANGDGINELKTAIEERYARGEIDYDRSAVLSSARQAAAVKSAMESVQSALSALDRGFTPDVAGMDLELAMSALGQTDGRSVSADIVDAIFHRFCVGK